MKPARLACLGAALLLLSGQLISGEPPADLGALRARAERGDPSAQYRLGLALTRSATTAAERTDAYVWLTLASESGASDKALETVLDTLSVAQVAEVRRRVEAARAANPALRPAAAPVIGLPAAGGVPVIAVPGGDAALQEQLNAALRDKTQLANELTAAWKEVEQLKAQVAQHAGAANDVSSAQKTIREIQANLARQSSELATARAEAAAARIENGKIVTQLNTAREQLATANDAKSKAEIALAASEQVAVARAEEVGKLRAAASAQELATLRDRATVTREFESRLRQLETEKAALAAAAAMPPTAPPAAPGVSPEELARATQALGDAEAKLATALRSYTLVTTERDELRGQVAELTAKLSTMTSAAASPAPTPTVLTPPVAPSVPTANPAPSRPVSPPAIRTHVIAVGDSLSSLSRLYYGTPNRWTEILAANRDVLIDERSLVAGKILRIP
jgi:nucleoid-associated protein YgaU